MLVAMAASLVAAVALGGEPSAVAPTIRGREPLPQRQLQILARVLEGARRNPELAVVVDSVKSEPFPGHARGAS
jgi:hypothetical protein